MKQVILDESFFVKVEKLDPLIHSESDIYYDEKFAYKVYINSGMSKTRFLETMNSKKLKLEFLSSINDLSHVILPEDFLYYIIKKWKIFAGYSMEYVSNSITLFEAYFKMSFVEFLQLICNVSVTLKKIHKRPEGIILGDLSFYNILVKFINDSYDYYFIDLDNITVRNLQSERISLLASDYSAFKNTRFKIDKNFDRLTFLLHFFDLVFGKEIYKVSMYEYDMMSEKMRVLSELRNIVLSLRNPQGNIPVIPYFHEVVYSLGKECGKESYEKIKL